MSTALQQRPTMTVEELRRAHVHRAKGVVMRQKAKYKPLEYSTIVRGARIAVDIMYEEYLTAQKVLRLDGTKKSAIWAAVDQTADRLAHRTDISQREFQLARDYFVYSLMNTSSRPTD